MLYHAYSRQQLNLDEYDDMYGLEETVRIIKITSGYKGEVREWFNNNKIDDWLKHNCEYYTKVWSSSNRIEKLTISFTYEQNINLFRETWL